MNLKACLFMIKFKIKFKELNGILNVQTLLLMFTRHTNKLKKLRLGLTKNVYAN